MTSKIHSQLRWLWLAAALFAAGGCATMNRPAAADTLRVAVNLKPNLNIIAEDNISRAFVDQVREVFHDEGFSRPVEEARLTDPTPLSQLLTFNLMEWRLTPGGNIECTFSADLETNAGPRHLGLYTSTVPRWIGGLGRWGLADSFDEAARDAINQLYRDITKTDLLRSPREGATADEVAA